MKNLSNEIKIKAFLGAYESNLDDAIRSFSKNAKAGVDMPNFLPKMEDACITWLDHSIQNMVLNPSLLEPRKAMRALVYMNLSIIKSFKHNMKEMGLSKNDSMSVGDVRGIFEQALFIPTGFAMLIDMILKTLSKDNLINQEIDDFIKNSLEEIDTDEMLKALGLNESDNQE